MDLNFINLISDLLRFRTVFGAVDWTYESYALFLRKVQSKSGSAGQSGFQICTGFLGKQIKKKKR